jgi:hypothetical protein
MRHQHSATSSVTIAAAMQYMKVPDRREEQQCGTNGGRVARSLGTRGGVAPSCVYAPSWRLYN